MKLFYAPGACSQAPHILLHEIGLSHDAERVDLKTKTREGGGSYLDISPKGAVPALQLDSGEVLTENAVVLQYLGDRAGGSDVLPPLGQFRRYRVLEWTNFITTELHKGFGPLFKPDAGDEVKEFARKNVADKLDFVEKQFSGPFLLGDDLTIADPYLFVMMRWAAKMLPGQSWPKLEAFRDRMLERDSVRHVLRFEGLLEPEPAG